MNGVAPSIEIGAAAADAAAASYAAELPAKLSAAGAGAGVDGSVTVELRRALPADVPEIAVLLDAYARRGLVLPRAIDQLYRHVREFHVAVDAEGVAGCGGLRIYSPVLAEVTALAVAERWQGRRVGRRIVERLVEEARLFGVRRVFALTRQEPFFLRLGFRTIELEAIPEKLAADRDEGIDRAAHRKTAVVRDLDDIGSCTGGT